MSPLTLALVAIAGIAIVWTNDELKPKQQQMATVAMVVLAAVAAWLTRPLVRTFAGKGAAVGGGGRTLGAEEMRTRRLQQLQTKMDEAKAE